MEGKEKKKKEKKRKEKKGEEEKEKWGKERKKHQREGKREKGVVLVTDGAKHHSTDNGQTTQHAQSGGGDGGGGDDADDTNNDDDATVPFADERCAAFDGCRVWMVTREHGASVQGGTCADTHDVGGSTPHTPHDGRTAHTRRQRHVVQEVPQHTAQRPTEQTSVHIRERVVVVACTRHREREPAQAPHTAHTHAEQSAAAEDAVSTVSGDVAEGNEQRNWK